MVSPFSNVKTKKALGPRPHYKKIELKYFTLFSLFFTSVLGSDRVNGTKFKLLVDSHFSSEASSFSLVIGPGMCL